MTQGVGNYLTPPLGNCLTLEAFSLGNYLIVDNWGLAVLEGQAANDVMDVVDDRAGVRSTVVASQLPVSEWHHLVGDPSIADALLDRLRHRAVRIELKGESLRRRGPQSGPQLT